MQEHLIDNLGLKNSRSDKSFCLHHSSGIETDLREFGRKAVRNYELFVLLVRVEYYLVVESVNFGRQDPLCDCVENSCDSVQRVFGH